MIKTFAFWLESIVEDDPLPREINAIVFCVKQNGKYVYLQMLGFEKEVNFNQLAFFPLEAQWYSNKELLNLSNKLLEYKIKNLIDECFANPILKQQYKGRKIYLYNNNLLEYLFIIE